MHSNWPHTATDDQKAAEFHVVHQYVRVFEALFLVAEDDGRVMVPSFAPTILLDAVACLVSWACAGVSGAVLVRFISPLGIFYGRNFISHPVVERRPLTNEPFVPTEPHRPVVVEANAASAAPGTLREEVLRTPNGLEQSAFALPKVPIRPRGCVCFVIERLASVKIV